MPGLILYHLDDHGKPTMLCQGSPRSYKTSGGTIKLGGSSGIVELPNGERLVSFLAPNTQKKIAQLVSLAYTKLWTIGPKSAAMFTLVNEGRFVVSLDWPPDCSFKIS